jgi:hypothetical protein
MTHYCKICSQPIHERRLAMGYKSTCVEHSSAQRYSGNIVADAKATTWMQVVKDPEVAAHLKQLSYSRGKV